MVTVRGSGDYIDEGTANLKCCSFFIFICYIRDSWPGILLFMPMQYVHTLYLIIIYRSKVIKNKRVLFHILGWQGLV